ncbi:MAG: peptidase M48 [Rhodopirellula sp.]|nr:peptidase M48 [Rhodopirellula sp.]
MKSTNSIISGGVFNDSIEGGRAGAEIGIGPQGISAILADGTRFDLSFEAVELEIGGASGKMVFCRNEDKTLTIFTEDKRFIHSLSAAGSMLIEQKVAECLKTNRKRGRKSRRNVLTGLVLLALACWGIYEVVLYGARAAVNSLPISIDQQIGEVAMSSMDLQGGVLEDPVVTDAIQSMVARLAPHASVSGFEFDVTVVDADILNAFALPGGKIVIYTGLIKEANRPEQVAGVLAHEMAHVTKRHGLQRIGQTLGISGLATLLAGDLGGLAVLTELLAFSTINKYSRTHETEADLEGVRMLVAAKIDPSGLEEFFEIMQHEHGDVPAAIAWISTHPDHEDRIREIQNSFQEETTAGFEPLHLDWDEIVKRVNR